MQLEKMGEFFDRRLQGYEEHQLNCIESAREFYPYTASLLPADGECEVLDLGCGTGIELDEYFRLNPRARVTGIDLAPGMLEALKKKHPDKALTLVNASYFDVPLGEERYDAAVSVESLHHFPSARKEALYRKIFRALRPGGYFVLTDYFAESPEREVEYFDVLARLKREQGIADEAFYHYDTPLTREHEIEALQSAGFSQISVEGEWSATACLLAQRPRV